MSEQAISIQQALAKYKFAESVVAEWQALYGGIRVKDQTDKANADAAHAARMVIKAKRVEIEKTRKELKEDALAYGKAVDAEAKRLTALLEPIELHLQEQEEIVTKYRQRLEAEAKAKAEAERAAVEAEAQRLREQVAKLEAEKLEAERALQRQAEVERIAKEAAEKASLETEARIQREAKAKEDAERAAQEAERKRIESAPDVEKLRSYADALLAVPVPSVATSDAADALARAQAAIQRIASDLTSALAKVAAV